MDSSSIDSIKWPSPWRPIDDEHEALRFGRRWSKQQIANTIVGELHREICESHPLHGRECTPVAYKTDCGKEFLFLTDIPESPVMLVHFTWHAESKPEFPAIKRYSSLHEFASKESRYRRKWWRL